MPLERGRLNLLIIFIMIFLLLGASAAIWTKGQYGCPGWPSY